jgi:hypothetical protein
MTRKYSLDEITQMRLAVLDLAGGNRASLTVVEDQLRTYMQNGTEPVELIDAARQHNDPIMRRQKELADLSRNWSQAPARNDLLGR